MVELMESQDWKVTESSQEHIKLEMYPSLIHEKINRKKTAEIKLVEKGEDYETVIMRINGDDIEKLKSVVEETDEGSQIQETGVSMKRFSPAYLEAILFMFPQIQETIDEITEENWDIVDENIDYGFSKFEIE